MNGTPDFEKLFRQHHVSLCNLAYTIVRDTDAAKDIVQDVFIKLWKNREKVEMGEQIKHYLLKATAHTALNHLRYSKRIVRIEKESVLNATLQAPAHAEEAGFKELEHHVRKAIDRLPPKCKVIYLLSRHEGLKYPQIAEALGLSVKTVENQMGIALQKLRDDLKPFLTIELLILVILSSWVAFSLWM